MADHTDSIEDQETISLVVAIIDFLRDQLITRTDLLLEDRDCLEIAVQSLEMVYDLEGDGYIRYRFSRPLIDIFNQVTNPASVKNKIRAEGHKEEGNSYMRRDMFCEADKEYTSAIELDKWNSIFYCNRAQARIKLNRYYDAIADCRQALMLNPDYAKAHGRMGQAYALIHRPREAARCFRQALELEPENERYRQNLTAAENEVNRPDPAQTITNLLALLLGIGAPSTQDSNLRTLPSSFMIITESHPPTQSLSSQNSQSMESSQTSQNATITEIDEEKNETSMTNSNNISDLRFPRPYGVIDEGSEERPIIEFEQPPENKNRENSCNPKESGIDVPLAAFSSKSQPPFSESDKTNLQNTEKLNEQPANNLDSINPDERNLPQDESDANDQVKLPSNQKDFASDDDKEDSSGKYVLPSEKVANSAENNLNKQTDKNGAPNDEEPNEKKVSENLD